MAVMSDANRQAAFVDYMRANTDTIAIVKADLRAATDAVDQWIDDNAASFNTALPQPARGSLTAKQKAQLLVFVVSRRFSLL